MQKIFIEVTNLIKQLIWTVFLLFEIIFVHYSTFLQLLQYLTIDISILKILSMTVLPAGDVINEVMTPACHTIFNTSILTILYMIIFNLIILPYQL